MGGFSSKCAHTVCTEKRDCVSGDHLGDVPERVFGRVGGGFLDVGGAELIEETDGFAMCIPADILDS